WVGSGRPPKPKSLRPGCPGTVQGAIEVFFSSRRYSMFPPPALPRKTIILALSWPGRQAADAPATATVPAPDPAASVPASETPRPKTLRCRAIDLSSHSTRPAGTLTLHRRTSPRADRAELEDQQREGDRNGRRQLVDDEKQQVHREPDGGGD